MTKIIIVEDDPMIAEIYTKKFSESGFEVFLATTGEQALALAKRGDIGVIMTDLIMPQMDGFQLVEALRNGEYNPQLKIIVASNLSQREDRERIMQLGANDFIAKMDFTPSQLIKEMQRLINKYRQQEKNRIRLESLAKGIDIYSGMVKKKILIIEDEEVFIDMFTYQLSQDGYEVDAANNGAWGIKQAMSKDYDLFVIDMIMPVMNGDEIIVKLKENDKTKNVPIIVLSASVEDNVARKVEKMGINAFYVKTQITPSILSDRIEEVFNAQKKSE